MAEEEAQDSWKPVEFPPIHIPQPDEE